MPIKAHNSIRIIKRYYSPLHYIYRIITTELLDIGKDITLQITFKTINNSIGPNSLIYTLLVFRAYLYIVKSDTPNPIVV